VKLVISGAITACAVRSPVQMPGRTQPYYSVNIAAISYMR
jgi:hypothetical protein